MAALWINVVACGIIGVCFVFWLWFLQDVRGIKHRTHLHFWMLLCLFCFHQFGAILSASAVILSAFLEGTVYFPVVEFAARMLGVGLISGGICSYLALISERLIATVYRSTYEKSKHPYFVSFLILCMLSYSVLYASCWNVFAINADAIMNPIMYTSYAITILMVLVLTYVNKQLSKLNLNSTIILSQRYQIYENRRMITFVTPLLVSGIAGLIISLIFTRTFGETYALNTQNRKIMYYTMFNGFLMGGLIFAIVQQPKRNARIRIFLRKCVHFASQSGHNSDISNLRVDPLGKIVRNKVGTVVNGKGHFEMLNNAWK